MEQKLLNKCVISDLINKCSQISIIWSHMEIWCDKRIPNRGIFPNLNNKCNQEKTVNVLLSPIPV